MTVAGFVLVCALDLLGRSASRLPPIVVLDERPADASSQAAAFVRRGEHVIYVIASAPVFQTALRLNRETTQCKGLDVLRLVASVIVHEEWHLRNGSDEQGAYFAQLTELQRLGAGPGRWSYESVRRAMQTTVERDAQRLRDAGRLAARAAPVAAAATPSARPPSDPLWTRAVQELTRLPALPR
jgi:hypothetical protein